MRAVFSAMRRSLMRAVMGLASSRRSARSTSRSVLRTGVLPSRNASRGQGSSKLMARAPRRGCGPTAKALRGSRHPVSPSMEPLWVRRFDWIPADLMIRRLFGCGLRHRHHRHEDAAFGFGAVLDPSVDEGEEGVVPAEPDVVPRMPLGAALARQDVAGKHALAAENLDAKALAIGIAAVARGAAGFLVGHSCYPECRSEFAKL